MCPSKVRPLKLALLFALAVAAFPTAGAFANHFYIVHPAAFWTPPSENVLFWATVDRDSWRTTPPSSEEYLIDHLVHH
jgi:hypothetical protein